MKNQKPLSIYIHIPFCEKRCPYCDFKSMGPADKQIITKYVDNLCDEIKEGSTKAKDRIVNTIYFGGGTPSFVDTAHVLKILDCIKINFGVSKNSEITIECNPNCLDRTKIVFYRMIGFNRISIGVQSFDDATLKVLGRLHTAQHTKNAIEIDDK